LGSDLEDEMALRGLLRKLGMESGAVMSSELSLLRIEIKHRIRNPSIFIYNRQIFFIIFIFL